MTIAALKKLTIIGDMDHRRSIMDQLQALGALHLIPLTAPTTTLSEDTADSVREALKYLQSAPNKRRLQQPIAQRPINTVAEEVLKNELAREQAIDRIDIIRTHQRALQPWGDFELPERGALGEYRLWFYRVPLRDKNLLAEINIPWKLVNRDHRFHYLVVLSETEPDSERLPFERAHTGSRSLSQLKVLKEQTLVELEDLNSERESLTRWLLPLSEALDGALDDHELQIAEQGVLDARECFVLQGWIPDSAEENLKYWAEALPLAYTLVSPKTGEQPPTLLENDDRIGGGEEAVRFFQLPGYRTWDPSGFIFFSFALFFAMIMADAGYALVLGVIVWIIDKRSQNANRAQHRIMLMAKTLVASSLLFGIVVGSYFGTTPPTESLLGKLHLLDMNNFDAMMKISIGTGALHLVVANTMAAWSRRGSRIAIAALGWAITVGCAFILWLEYMTGTDSAIPTMKSFPGIVLGIAMILLFSGERSLRSASGCTLQLFDGVKALYGLSKAFGDVLSYMRLFALGLSSASLAITFNALAISARDAMPTGGFIVFALILLFGHGLNFALGIMSGVIHGLRLNLLEFYNWGIQDEGYAFKSFKKRGASPWNNL